MKTAVRSKLITLIILLAALMAVSLLLMGMFRPKQVDPHEGQVYIDDGFGMVWMTPLEGVAVNTLGEKDFDIINGVPYYNGDAYAVLRGVDVSEHQHEIDWSQAARNMDFAMIRLGRRGYTEGGLFEDEYFEANMRGALNNGLDVGVYMFSQAVTVQEAIEEAEFVIRRLEGYKVTMPVVFDWEKIEGADARTDGLDTGILNDCAVAFCETIRAAGYEPAVYFNRYMGYYGFDLSRLTDYTFWAAVPGTYPDFYYASDIWQYTFSADIPGIYTETDMNLMFIPKPQAANETH